MQTGYSLQHHQVQQHRLSFEMRQSLAILRAGLPELRELLAKAVYENPLLEMDEPKVTPVEVLIDGYDFYDSHFLYPEERPEITPQEIGARDSFAHNLQSRSAPTFKEAVLEQLNTTIIDGEYLRLCQNLVEHMDRRGYITDELPALAELLCCSVFEAEQALYLIQSLQPAGVGARSLQECLILQLARSAHLNCFTLKLVNEGLSLLAEGDITALSRLLRTSRETTLQTASIVKSLNPIPSQGYDTEERNCYIIPDAAVERTGKGFEITFNSGALPRLRLNDEYLRLTGNADKALRQCVRSYSQKASGLIKSISARTDTIVRILKAVVERQPDFFESGERLTPMLMSEIAREMGLNVSTVSRAVRDKYVVCAAGTVELSSLFTLPAAKIGGSTVSSEMVKAGIVLVITGEDAARPLSDEDIRKALMIKGIDISRRTVAKYREAAGIKSSSKRKL